ncbi:MAG TPA: DUF6387 family protein [Candidatus Ozemobacteraceae bacterium]
MGKRGPPLDDIPLPEWFDLGKYARAGELTLAEWYDQLMLRYGPWHRDFTARPLGRRGKMRLDLIRRDGIPDLARLRAGDDPLREALPNLSRESRGGGSARERATLVPLLESDPVSSLSVREFCNMFTAFKADRREKCREAFEDFRAFCVDDPPGAEWLKEPVDTVSGWGFNKATLRIDLEYPDDALVDGFKAFLGAARKRTGLMDPGKRKSPKAPETLQKWWADSRVLPYIDLATWAAETRTHISDAAMARAIGDAKGGGRGGEAISETVYPLARKLLSLSYLKKLKSRIESGE